MNTTLCALPVGTKVRIPGNPTLWQVVGMSVSTRVQIAPASLGKFYTEADRLVFLPSALEVVS